LGANSDLQANLEVQAMSVEILCEEDWHHPRAGQWSHTEEVRLQGPSE
jgi:hypothetical protein